MKSGTNILESVLLYFSRCCCYLYIFCNFSWPRRICYNLDSTYTVYIILYSWVYYNLDNIMTLLNIDRKAWGISPVSQGFGIEPWREHHIVSKNLQNSLNMLKTSIHNRTVIQSCMLKLKSTLEQQMIQFVRKRE